MRFHRRCVMTLPKQSWTGWLRAGAATLGVGAAMAIDEGAPPPARRHGTTRLRKFERLVTGGGLHGVHGVHRSRSPRSGRVARRTTALIGDDEIPLGPTRAQRQLGAAQLNPYAVGFS